MPVYINFNGSFERFDDESEQQAILRLIAAQLVDTTSFDRASNTRIICDELKLEEYIASTIAATSRKLILLIDELNTLAFPPDREAASLLRRMFLNPKHRYLVYSTHRPIDIDPKSFTPAGALMGVGSASSSRGILLASMPESYDLGAIQGISSVCRAVSRPEIALCGGIPSLIYSMNVSSGSRQAIDWRFTVATKYWSQQQWSDVACRNLLKEFVRAVYVGAGDVTPFEEFSSISKSEIKFPLFFIGKILEYLNRDIGLESVDSIVKLISTELVVLPSPSNSGKEWETIITIAIMLRCTLAEVTKAPLRIFGEEFSPVVKVRLISIPPQISDLEAAHTFMVRTTHDAAPGTVIVFTPSCATFPVVDGFVVYKPMQTSDLIILAHQEKAVRAVPTVEVPYWVKRAIMLRVLPPENHNATSASLNTWTYFVKNEIEELLGCSMRALLRLNWGQ